ncbi:MAG TPA: class I SAM-dependent methyltransferase [Thermoanaerobaculia bacterium]|nr:class I SAM-dependent methyltransferase [Thermoanaerobaculia bacterium]
MQAAADVTPPPLPAAASQRQEAAAAKALYDDWRENLVAGEPTGGTAARLVDDAAARADALGRALAAGAISTAEHNAQRRVMVRALRSFIDAGCEEPAARRISRAMLDLVLDSPPLPHPRYRFTTDWVSPHVAAWERELAHLRGRPAVRGLEIGCYEGQSACWWLDNVLTDPTSSLTCVDPFAAPMGSVLLRNEGAFDRNIAASGAGHRVFKLVGSSQVVLRMLPPASFDFAYVDGSHKVGDVLQDAVLTWELLRAGGIAIFDDYEVAEETVAGLPARAPGRALDAFAGLLGSGAAVLRRDWQLVLRKA